MSRFSSLLCSLLFCMITYAQEITVTGKVTAGGEEMPGVTVAVKGQTRGTITSIDGSYQIQVNGNESLIFSFVGYETVTSIPPNRFRFSPSGCMIPRYGRLEIIVPKQIFGSGE